MAYRVSKTSALQTAVKAAVDIALAELNAGLVTSHEDVMSLIGTLRDEFSATLFEEVDRDNALLDADAISGGSSRSNRGGNGGGSAFSSQEAADTVLNFGAFKGLTLGQVYHMDASEAAAYSGGNYTKAGQDWLRWAAANKDPKGNFIKKRAQAVLDNPPAP